MASFGFSLQIGSIWTVAVPWFENLHEPSLGILGTKMLGRWGPLKGEKLKSISPQTWGRPAKLICSEVLFFFHSQIQLTDSDSETLIWIAKWHGAQIKLPRETRGAEDQMAHEMRLVVLLLPLLNLEPCALFFCLCAYLKPTHPCIHFLSAPFLLLGSCGQLGI